MDLVMWQCFKIIPKAHKFKMEVKGKFKDPQPRLANEGVQIKPENQNSY